jgi:hypothetical protein
VCVHDNNNNNRNDGELVSALIGAPNAEAGGKPTVGRVFFDSFLYAIHMSTAYILMLIIMSYNLGLISVVVTGCWFGHFVMTLAFNRHTKVSHCKRTSIY